MQNNELPLGSPVVQTARYNHVVGLLKNLNEAVDAYWVRGDGRSYLAMREAQGASSEWLRDAGVLK